MKFRTCALIVLGLLLISGMLATQSTSSAAAGPLSGIKVCLDPGHGGSDPSDPGAVNIEFGLEEADINLDVSFGLKWLLEAEGAAVVMTRTGDDYLDNSDRYTFCNAEEATILISVHTNSVVNPDWDGSMTLYAPSRDPDLAQAIHERLYPFLRDTAPEGVTEFRDFGLDNFASGVLFKCDMPAAMMEPLFMSNPHEAALLVQPIFEDLEATDQPVPNCASFSCRRGQIAQAILEGVFNYYDGGPPPEPTSLLQVSAITMWYQLKGGNIFVYSQVTVQDQTGDPVPGAAVEIETELPDGSTLLESNSTGEDGTVTFKLRSDQSGRYTSSVLNVSKEGWDYDPAGSGQLAETLSVPQRVKLTE